MGLSKVAASTSPAAPSPAPEAAEGSQKLAEAASDRSPRLAPVLPSSSLLTLVGGCQGPNGAPSVAGGRGRAASKGAPKRAPSAAVGRGPEGSAPSGRLLEEPRGVLSNGGPLRPARAAGGDPEGFSSAGRLPEGLRGVSTIGGPSRAPRAAGGVPEGLLPSGRLPEGSGGTSASGEPLRAAHAAVGDFEGFPAAGCLPEGSGRVPPPGTPSGGGVPGAGGGYGLGSVQGEVQDSPVHRGPQLVGVRGPLVAPGGSASEAQGAAPAPLGGPSSAASDHGPSNAVREQLTCPITQVW